MKKLLIFNLTLVFLLTGCIAQTSAAAKPAILMTAEELVVAFKFQGLPISAHKIFTEANDPDRLLGKSKSYISKASFTDPLTLDVDYYLSNAIEVFANPDDARVRHDQLMNAQSDAMIKHYLYLKGSYLLSLSNKMSQKDAQKYVYVFQGLVDKRASGVNGPKFPK